MPTSPEWKRGRYHRLDDAGVCVHCAKPRDTGAKMCERCRASSARASNRWKAKQTDYDRKKALRRKYGMTNEQWNEMLAAQNSKCAICGTDKPVRAWTVDHCHNGGGVRGILCHPCNVGLGQFRDDPGIIEQAATYLRRHRALRAV